MSTPEEKDANNTVTLTPTQLDNVQANYQMLQNEFKMDCSHLIDLYAAQVPDLERIAIMRELIYEESKALNACLKALLSGQVSDVTRVTEERLSWPE